MTARWSFASHCIMLMTTAPPLHHPKMEVSLFAKCLGHMGPLNDSSDLFALFP